MRDKRRIKKVLRVLGKLWKKYPDLRLMQLLLNTSVHYHTEDDTLLNILNSVYGDQNEQKKTKQTKFKKGAKLDGAEEAGK